MKRLFDIVLSTTGLIVIAPILLAVAIAIKLDSEGPVFYKGTRAGKGEKPFHMYKFRSMVINADKIGGPSTSDDDPRVTRMGHFVRKWKLDELPQLINVWKGEMSFVGPRPEVLSETETYTQEQKKIFTLRPGITDFASLAFPNEGEILKGAKDPHEAYKRLIQPKKLELQLKYVAEHTFMTDLKIIFKTIRTVFTK